MLLRKHGRLALLVPVVIIALMWPPSAKASVTCSVRRHDQYVCTFYCQNGFTCDMGNMRCLPGEGVKRKLSELQETARKAQLVNNRMQMASARDAVSKATGFDGASPYYNWDGDPREIPTPRYRQGGGIPASFGSRSALLRAAPVRQPQQVRVRPQTRSQLLALVAATRSFAANDPNRPGAIKLLNKFVRDNKIPVDVHDLLSCDSPKTAPVSQPTTHNLRWGIADIEPEIEKRGLCADAKSDDEHQACVASQFGQVVMSVEPEIKAQCKMQENDPQEKDPAALGICAENMFRNAWSRDGKIQTLASSSAAADAAKCPDIGVNDDLDSLRERLRKALSEGHAPAHALADDEAIPTADSPPATAPQHSEPPPEQAANDDDDPFCDYIARRSVRGELTPGAGDKIPDYCLKAVDKMKSCTDQKCSMADIIDRQEHAQPVMHWGVEDYQGIERLGRQR